MQTKNGKLLEEALQGKLIKAQYAIPAPAANSMKSQEKRRFMENMTMHLANKIAKEMIDKRLILFEIEDDEFSKTITAYASVKKLKIDPSNRGEGRFGHTGRK